MKNDGCPMTGQPCRVGIRPFKKAKRITVSAVYRITRKTTVIQMLTG